MPKQISVTQAQLDWLEEAVDDGTSYTAMAEKIGCNVDTLKRILMRNKLAFFEGAKYVVARETTVKMWNRACMTCGSKEERPKWQYICDGCHDKSEEAESLPDNWH